MKPKLWNVSRLLLLASVFMLLQACATSGDSVNSTHRDGHASATTTLQTEQASGTLTISGAVTKVFMLDLGALRSLADGTVSVGNAVYSGVPLWTLLDKVAGIKTESSAMNAKLAMYVVARGRDGYRALFSVGELDPEFGNHRVLVAFSAGGKPLERGTFRLIVPRDVKRGRAVFDLISVELSVAGGGHP